MAMTIDEQNRERERERDVKECQQKEEYSKAVKSKDNSYST
jgi:hypothetical protein